MVVATADGGRFTVTGLVDDASGPLSATLYVDEDVLAATRAALGLSAPRRP